MNNNGHSAGELLRLWRQRRRLSQLALATEADVSQRHLSFVESGRAAPSREMLLRLTEQLDIPLRERNVLLMTAGYAPLYQERALNDPGLAAARRVVDMILKGHEPYPALAIDRHWTMLAANKAVGRLLVGVDPALMQPPVNALRLSMHPDALAPRIANFRAWRELVLARLAQQVDNSADAGLMMLIEELKHYPVPQGARPPGQRSDYAGLAIPLELVSEQGILRFLGTTTVFGTPLDVGLSELAIESFFPADALTATAMRELAGSA
ncbi:MAG: helix-turn-helix domain-containing protein [Ectothiorhodospiraceae bacterium]|nr:helix-turn-helix domain-containing protein [Ectothiorhodospiraceae bacterium]